MSLITRLLTASSPLRLRAMETMSRVSYNFKINRETPCRVM